MLDFLETALDISYIFLARSTILGLQDSLYTHMIDSKTVAWIGGSFIAFFSFVFIYVIQIKIQKWKEQSIPPLPLEGFLSISSYCSILAGFTVMFTGVLEVFTFSTINSLIASFLLAFFTGAPMWGVVKGLLREIEAGELKEIVPVKK